MRTKGNTYKPRSWIINVIVTVIGLTCGILLVQYTAITSNFKQLYLVNGVIALLVTLAVSTIKSLENIKGLEFLTPTERDRIKVRIREVRKTVRRYIYFFILTGSLSILTSSSIDGESSIRDYAIYLLTIFVFKSIYYGHIINQARDKALEFVESIEERARERESKNRTLSKLTAIVS